MIKKHERIRSPKHLKWIRSLPCVISDPVFCSRNVQAAHVRTGTDGAMSMKPSDCWVIPLCSKHHQEQHSIGERSFEDRHLIDMKKIADDLWRRSRTPRVIR